MRVLFLTGSDTDVGKTFITSQLTQTLNSLGLKALALKPIETGVISTPLDGAIHLKNAQTILPNLKIQDIVLYTFPLPASPFVADTKGEIECERILSYISSFEGVVDVLMIEGAGGLFVPIGQDYFMIDLACDLQERFGSEVVFVCDDRLGMLNRLLSGRALLQSRGLAHHLLINLRDSKNFEQISLPFLSKSQIPYHTDISSLLHSLLLCK